MISLARCGSRRWLRLALAVLALLASQVSSARAALGATCPRTGHTSDVAAGLPSGVAGATAVDRMPSYGEPTPEVPASPVPAATCATSVAALPPAVEAPTARTVWRAVALASGPEARPLGLAPPPPFHPPRST